MSKKYNHEKAVASASKYIALGTTLVVIFAAIAPAMAKNDFGSTSAGMFQSGPQIQSPMMQMQPMPQMNMIPNMGQMNMPPMNMGPMGPMGGDQGFQLNQADNISQEYENLSNDMDNQDVACSELVSKKKDVASICNALDATVASLPQKELDTEAAVGAIDDQMDTLDEKYQPQMEAIQEKMETLGDEMSEAMQSGDFDVVKSLKSQVAQLQKQIRPIQTAQNKERKLLQSSRTKLINAYNKVISKVRSDMNTVRTAINGASRTKMNQQNEQNRKMMEEQQNQQNQQNQNNGPMMQGPGMQMPNMGPGMPSGMTPEMMDRMRDMGGSTRMPNNGPMNFGSQNNGPMMQGPGMQMPNMGSGMPSGMTPEMMERMKQMGGSSSGMQGPMNFGGQNNGQPMFNMPNNDQMMQGPMNFGGQNNTPMNFGSPTNMPMPAPMPSMPN